MPRTKQAPVEDDDDVFGKAAEVAKKVKGAIEHVEGKPNNEETRKEIVDKTSAALRDSLNRPTDEEPFDPKAAAEAFVGRHKTTDVRVDERLDRIVERVVNVDALDDYEELEGKLRIGEKRTEYGTVAKHLDDAEDDARRAHRLFVAAKLEYDRWVAETEVVLAPMRTEAVRALEQEKREGLRSKQITDADVVAKMAALYPDEFVHQESKRAKMKRTIDHLENFSDRWARRCGDLNALISTMRK